VQINIKPTTTTATTATTATPATTTTTYQYSVCRTYEYYQNIVNHEILFARYRLVFLNGLNMC
jgi:hypothetical protein